MSSSSTALETRPSPLTRLALIAPAMLVSAALFAFDRLGPGSPYALVLAAPLAALALILVLQSAPLLLFWLVPVSMCWFIYLPVLHYEALVLVLAGVMSVNALPRFKWREVRLEPIEWRYLLFLLAVLPGAVGAISMWRFVGGLKFYLVGLLGFEVARRGGRRLGAEAMLWGPALFIVISAALLTARVATSGVPGFKSAELRTYLATLSWGVSNYIAAVFVLCMPTLALLVQISPARSYRRVCALAVLIFTLVAMLLTTSRGGALLAMAYLMTLATGRRRPLVWGGVTLLVAALALMLTPFGQGLLRRLLDVQGWDSAIYRVIIWRLALLRGIAHLPFGLGAAQGLVQNDALQAVDPHNFLLTLFSEVGPLALVLWLWTFAALWRRSGELRRQPIARAIGHAFRGTLLLAFVNMLFEPTMPGNLYHLLFWWLVGVFYGAGERTEVSAAPGV